ncbi:MBL fold metallo-hydrolase [bacterium]|nr:MBL fold metallo-hydrolase [bacterium]
MIDYTIIPVTAFAQNCSLLVDTTTAASAAVVVDPGGDIDAIVEVIASRRLDVARILLTHGHADHVGAAAELSQRLGVAISGPHREDAFWLDALPDQCRMFGLPATAALQPHEWLQEGDKVTFGAATLEVLHTPGHTPGHVCFVSRADKLAVVGDVLFAGSIGRTDFPRGDHETLLRVIHEKLLPLGDEFTFIPGHGPVSTFGVERSDNPYVANWRSR